MSISTTNPFDLLDENGGRPRKAKVAPKPVVATPKPAAEAPKVQQPAQPKAAPAKAAPAANTAAPAKKENDAKPRPQGDAPKGNKNAGKDGAVKKAPAQQQQQPRQQQQQQAAPARADDAVAEKPRERRDRDHRTHDRPSNRGRQFDRRSGTGRPANENKKSGSGKGNWGTLEEGQEGVVAAEVSKELAEGEKEEAVAGEGEVAASPEIETAPPKEPEKELLSLDEYYATLKNKVVTSVEAPKIRQAGEGVDQAAWANYAPLTKEEENLTAPLKKKKESKKDAANGKDEKTIPFQFTMAPHETFGEGRRGGRGGFRGGSQGRGGGRGGRGGRGGQRFEGDRRQGGNSNGSTPSTTTGFDMSQFPTLGGAPAQSAAPAPVKA